MDKKNRGSDRSSKSKMNDDDAMHHSKTQKESSKDSKAHMSEDDSKEKGKADHGSKSKW